MVSKKSRREGIMDKKNISLLFKFSIFLIIIIAGIYLLPGKHVDPKFDEKIMQCIADNSELFASTTCGHCNEQKKILENYTEIFNITNCDQDTTGICAERGIQLVPFWVIDNEGYIGLKTIEELKNLTNC